MLAEWVVILDGKETASLSDPGPMTRGTPKSNQAEMQSMSYSMPITFDLSITLGELLACTEATTKLYMQSTKEYIEMKKILDISQAIMREKLWLIKNSQSSMEKFQGLVEGIGLAVLIEYREFERDNHPPI